MCSAELLHKWSPAKPDSHVKGTGSKGALVSNFRMTIRDYVSWHSRISSLIFLCILLGVGAICAVITTLNAVGYLSNPNSGFLSTGFTALPPYSQLVRSEPIHEPSAVDPVHGSNTTTTPPHNPSLEGTNVTRANTTLLDDVLYEEKTEEANTNWVDDELYKEKTEAANATLIDDELYEEKTETPSSFGAHLVLMPHPVDLKPLSDVYHDMSEAELLWRASAGTLRRPRAESATSKVAYMFLTRGALPLRLLWERYFKGHGDLYNIYVHAHPNYQPNFPPDSVFYRRNIPSKEVFWGKLSVFAAERRLLANALLDPANERFLLLSESCIPITPLPVAYKYFMESKHSFVEAYFKPGKGGMGRYTRIKNRRKLNPEITPAQWRKGSQWFEMSRELALVVVSDRKYYPKFEEFLCMHDCICYIDEHYLPTVLTILAPSKLANRTSHYIDFARSTAHPHQWDKEAINERMLKSITTGHNCTYNGKLTDTCHMFARKFSPGTIEHLLRLAASSLGIP